MSVTAPRGFTAAGVASGIKPDGSRDVALVVGDPGALGAAVFTTNRAPAAPVLVSRRHLAAGPATRAVVINSGCANAATGARGDDVALAGAERVADLVGCAPEEVLVCSTGPIGTTLDEDALLHGIELAVSELGPGVDAGRAAAEAIMTTDSVPKEAVAAAGAVTVGGMAKGAGMIRPDMATMLAVVTTDATLAAGDLAAVLTSAVAPSFNALDVDGCQSTNDTVVLLASGATSETASIDAVARAVEEVCRDLAGQIAADAEGSSRVVRIRVNGGANDQHALRLARAVADSALVRSSFYGGDPNWGRIIGALGAAGVEMDVAQVGIAFDGVVVAQRGTSAHADEDALAQRLETGDFAVEITAGSGPGRAEVLTADLTPDYVRFNGERS